MLRQELPHSNFLPEQEELDGAGTIFLYTKGTVPPKVKEAIYAQTDMDALNQWLLLASGAGNMEEFINGMHSRAGRYQKTVE